MRQSLCPVSCKRRQMTDSLYVVVRALTHISTSRSWWCAKLTLPCKWHYDILLKGWNFRCLECYLAVIVVHVCQEYQIIIVLKGPLCMPFLPWLLSLFLMRCKARFNNCYQGNGTNWYSDVAASSLGWHFGWKCLGTTCWELKLCCLHRLTFNWQTLWKGQIWGGQLNL